MTLRRTDGDEESRAIVGSGARPWLPLNALRAFEAVGTARSFTGAAGALHVSQSALSRHVGRLEELIGCRLLERRPGGVVLTAAGAALLPVVVRAFDRIEKTMGALRRDVSGPRVLRVQMPSTFLAVFGLPLLKAFRSAFPEITVDVSSHNGLGLQSARVDVAVVFDRPAVDETVRDLLWMVVCTPACAPAVAARAEGQTLHAFLRAAELLHMKLAGEPFGLWADYAAHHAIAMNVRRGLAFDTEALVVQAAVAGSGVALLDTRMWAAEFADGRLVTPFPEVWDSGFGYYLALHPDDLPDPAIALFRSWVIARFAASQDVAAAGIPQRDDAAR